MNKKKNIFFFLVLIIFTNCSFDKKTGFWDGNDEEKRQISELEKAQSKTISTKSIYLSESEYKTEKNLSQKIKLTKPQKNLAWETYGKNNQNIVSNIHLSNIDNFFLKKKIGKNKFGLSKVTTNLLIYNNNIFVSDDTGTIYSVSQSGKINWKKNIYKKIYKKFYKILSFSINKNNIFVSDNVGFIYALNIDTGKIIWIKNHGVPLKSKMKVFDSKIFLINQDNRVLAINTNDGSMVWNFRSITSFIKSQNLLSLAISKNNDLIASTSTGDLLKINLKNGSLQWSLSTLKSSIIDATDFFQSSDIVLDGEDIIFSTQSSLFSYSLINGYMNWETNVDAIGQPIINNGNIFLVTENGFFVIVDQSNGKIISSNNILKILKVKKQSTSILGFIMGSGKVYALTHNGYLITSSALTGKTESSIKIADGFASNPVIVNGKMFLYTNKFKILGLN